MAFDNICWLYGGNAFSHSIDTIDLDAFYLE